MMVTTAIKQTDAVLAEDGRTVLFLGHTEDEDVTFIASITLPMPIDEAAFLVDEWRDIAPSLEWRQA